jgi:hypothetical protein
LKIIAGGGGIVVYNDRMKKLIYWNVLLMFLFVVPVHAELTAVIRGAVIRGAVIAPAVPDQCTGTFSPPVIGAQCVTGALGGTKQALYAGTYNGYKYMTTPSGCGTAIPSSDTCNGGADSTMVWATAATTAATTKIIASPSMVDGKSQSATIAAVTGSIVAKFCEEMTFGGYDDWYLPAMNAASGCTNYSGELYQVLYKNSNQYRPNNNGSCNTAIVAGPLTGFEASYYWSSTEDSATVSWLQYFTNGNQTNGTKTGNFYVRCVRRY